MDPDDVHNPKPKLAIGEPLDAISVDELQQRIADFGAEILRLKAEIARKQASKMAADAFFKS